MPARGPGRRPARRRTRRESWNAAPPVAAREPPRAALAGRPRSARSTSSVSRPSSRSRTAPPTSHAVLAGQRLARGLAAPRRSPSRSTRGTRARDPAGHLVVDRAERARPSPRRGSARRPARRSARPPRRAPTGSSAPRSTVMLSIDTVPTSGTRRPPTSTSARLRQPAADAVAVADRDRRRARSSRSATNRAPVAGALARRGALDLGDVADAARAPARGRARPGRAGTGPCRRSRSRSGPGRGATAGSPQRRRRVRGVATRPGWRRERVRPGREARELLGHERRVVVGGREVGHQRPRAAARAPRRRRRPASASRGVARAEPPHAGVELDVHAACRPRRSAASAATNASRQATTSASRRERDRQLLGATARPGPAAARRRPPPRSAAASLGGRHRQPARPAALRGARGGDRPVPVAVGLDDRAQRAPAPRRGQPRAVALDRAHVDPGQRPTAQHGRYVRRQRVEHVDAGDHAHEPAVLDHREPVVLVPRDHPRGLVRRGVGLDRDRVLGHQVLRVAADRLAQRAPRSAAVDSRNTTPAEQLDVVRAGAGRRSSPARIRSASVMMPTQRPPSLTTGMPGSSCSRSTRTTVSIGSSG